MTHSLQSNPKLNPIQSKSISKLFSPDFQVSSFDILNEYFGSYWFYLPLTYNVPIMFHSAYNKSGHHVHFWSQNKQRVLNYLGTRPWTRNPKNEAYKEFFEVYNSLGQDIHNLLKQ